MSVASLLSSSHKTAFSFEVLPPMRGRNIDSLFSSIDKLMAFNPAYINITTHRTETVFREVSPGSFRRIEEHKRPGTVAVAAALKGRYNIMTVPHIICSAFTRSELEDELIDLSYLGITDLLVLRGDRAKGENRFIPIENGYEHSVDLCRQVDSFNKGLMVNGDAHDALEEQFTFGVAGYPEKHEEAMNMDTDLFYLKEKVDAGAKYIVTQMFFDNKKYFDFVDRCRAIDINVPIIPGIKPLTSLTQKLLLPRVFHIDFPTELATELQKCKSNDDVKTLGVEWGIAQAKELQAANIPSIHFYSMNSTASVEAIAKQVY